MSPQRILLPHLPPTLPIYISAYHTVTNTPHLLSQLLASNPKYNYTFIDARTLLSRRHLLTACFRALTDHLHGRLKSNNVHSEIVLCLSPNNNVGEALRRFGVGEGSRNLVVVRVGGEEGDVVEGLRGLVEGVEVEWDGVEGWLGRVCEVVVVRGNYRLGKAGQGGGGGGGGKRKGDVEVAVNGDGGGEDDSESKQREMKELERVVLGLMALRGAT